MAAPSHARLGAGFFPEGRANTQLKASFGAWLWGSLALSAGVHFAVLAMVSFKPPPDLRVPRVQPLEQIELLMPLELPPPPDVIIRPGVPVLATTLEYVDVSIPEFNFENRLVIDLPPPPIPPVDFSDQPAWTPRDIEPELRNRREIEQFLRLHYPLSLERARIGGTVVFEAYLDEDGAVQEIRRVTSSGIRALDNLAERVFARMKFTPAYYRYRPAAVWVRMPIRFVPPS